MTTIEENAILRKILSNLMFILKMPFYRQSYSWICSTYKKLNNENLEDLLKEIDIPEPIYNERGMHNGE